jgi:hypothetical protein
MLRARAAGPKSLAAADARRNCTNRYSEAWATLIRMTAEWSVSCAPSTAVLQRLRRPLQPDTIFDVHQQSTNHMSWMGMAKNRIVWFGMKVTPEQKRRIRRLAEREGVSAKEAVLRLVDRALSDDPIAVPPGSFLDGIQHLIGAVEGPTDLSTNPKHMDGFGR